MNERRMWYITVLAVVALLAAACDSGDSDDVGDGDTQSDANTAEAETETAEGDEAVNDEAVEGALDETAASDTTEEAADEAPEAGGGGGDDCIVGQWQAVPGTVGAAYEQILSQAQAEGGLEGVESEIDGTQLVDIRSDGTLTSKGEFTMVLTIPGQPEVQGEGTVDTEANWSTEGDQLTFETTALETDMVMSIGGQTIPIGEGAVPTSELETTVSTYACSGDRLSINVAESGLQFSSELERTG